MCTFHSEFCLISWNEITNCGDNHLVYDVEYRQWYALKLGRSTTKLYHLRGRIGCNFTLCIFPDFLLSRQVFNIESSWQESRDTDNHISHFESNQWTTYFFISHLVVFPKANFLGYIGFVTKLFWVRRLWYGSMKMNFCFCFVFAFSLIMIDEGHESLEVVF